MVEFGIFLFFKKKIENKNPNGLVLGSNSQKPNRIKKKVNIFILKWCPVVVFYRT